MDRQQPVASLDDAYDTLRRIDRRTEARLAADVVHAAAYLIPGRCDPRQRRAAAARLVRDALAVLAAVGGTVEDVVDAARLMELYGGSGGGPTVGERGDELELPAAEAILRSAAAAAWAATHRPASAAAAGPVAAHVIRPATGPGAITDNRPDDHAAAYDTTRAHPGSRVDAADNTGPERDHSPLR
jgi:hypothetical protein